MSEKFWLVLILVLFFVLGVYYALLTPVFEASDELWHYPMVRHLADGNELPVQVFDPEIAGPWKQEASQPPLYYYLGALLTFWIDTSDMDQIRWLNPHVDNGVITADGNINLVVHDPDQDPFQGTLLAVRIVRLFSVLLGLTTVYLTYAIARKAAPERAEIALGAAAANAFLPMFVFISGAVNNDNLIITLSSASLLLMIIIGTSNFEGIGLYASTVGLGCLIGMAALTKMSALGLVPLAMGTIFINRWRRHDRDLNFSTLGPMLLQWLGLTILIILPALLISGWWYYRNYTLYGDWSGWNAFIAVLGQRQTPASIAQLWDERWGFMSSYWGLFGGLNVPMPEWIYWSLNILVILSVVGFMVYAFQQLKRWYQEQTQPFRSFSRTINSLLKLCEDYLALILCVLWAVAVIVGLVRWATTTWSSQGRLVFSAISALSTLFMIGLVGWLPSKPAKGTALGTGLGLLIIAVLAPVLWIRPAYQPQDVITNADEQLIDENFDQSLLLESYRVSPTSVRPGEKVDVVLSWQVLSEMDRDWSVFVHLVDPVIGGPVAQRDMYHRQGLQPTSLAQVGDQWTDHYIVAVPESAVSPADLVLQVGLYDFKAGDRSEVGSGEDSIVLGEILLEPISDDIPNSLNINFENQLELAGFEISPRRAVPGESIQLTLYLKAMESLEKDYTVFAQVIGEDTTRWASQDLLQDTSQWKPEVVQEAVLNLPVLPETPAKIYPIIIGVYERTDDGGFDRLQVVTSDGRLTDDFYNLTSVRIDASD